ncbi:MAG: hypothetical protein Q4B48_04420, partial [Syntrophomonadaceae bacterium]|nr:hypothetical protein [Syntrophomonadaceae bacterium]
MRGLRDDKGFTLLELLLALPLALLILTALLLLLKVGVGSFDSGRASSDAHYALRHVRSALVDDIVAAHNCTVSAHPGGAELSAGRAGGCLTLEGIDEYGGDYTIS